MLVWLNPAGLGLIWLVWTHPFGVNTINVSLSEAGMADVTRNTAIG